MSIVSKIGFVLLASAALQADASVITFSTAYSTAQPQATADAYRSVVDAALQSQTAGYGTKRYADFNLSNSFGASSNIAEMTIVNFDVTAGQSGSWSFRVGGDYGFGAAMFIDDMVVAFNKNDMWWNNSYSNPTQFLAATVNLSAGSHTLKVFGLENCCNGNEQGQYRIGSGAYTTFAANDGLGGTVPEPATLASVLLGLGMLAVLRRRA